MTREQWQELKDVLHRALELAPEQRRTFLDQVCPEDAPLRREVESLLSASDEVRTSFLRSAVAPVTIKPGTRLGDYEVQRLIGSGGMGEVYRAHDTRLKRDVAVKVLPPFVSDDADRLRRFEQEARAAASLNHPNILAVYQMGTYEGTPYLVSELLEGSTLREQLRGALPVRKAIDYGVQIARGLAAAHDKGITHRDLKPENLFVTKDGRVKILDFGLAKLTQVQNHSKHSAPTLGNGTEPGVVMGTVGYMAPEQARGQSVDHRSDIFAFGAILYEMLAGKRAFQKPTSAETMNAILNDDPPAISQIALGVPPALQRVVHRCLEKGPERRFQSASDLAFALEALSDSGSASATSLSTTKPAIRRTWIALGVAALVFAGVVVVLQRPTTTPQVLGVVQLTHDGRPKPTSSLLASDGSRLFFMEQHGGTPEIAQVSVAGGETVPLASNLINPSVLDIAPDSSALLISYGTVEANYIGLMPLPGGQMRTIGKAESAGFFPDGKRIAYCTGHALYVAQKDGANPQVISKTACDPNFSFPLPISRDGSRIRMPVMNNLVPTFWEIQADGKEFRELEEPVPSWNGRWTADGEFFVFARRALGGRDLWIRPEKHQMFSRSQAILQLTNGPLSFDSPLPSRDGKRIYAIGYQNRGELVRYDSASKQFLSVFDGISATDVMYSADREWLIYTSYPDHTLWRSRADGSERLQLTFAPMEVLFPHISPDAKQIEFLGLVPGSGAATYMTYIVDMAGGEPKRVTNGFSASAWSFDGKSLILEMRVQGKTNDQDSSQLAFYNIESGTASIIPDSQDKFGPFQPTPQMIVSGGPQDNLYWFDCTTRKWSVFADGPATNWMISQDSRYLYFVRETPGNPQAMRVRFSDHKIETIASLKGFRRVADPEISGYSWIGVGSDGSLLLTRDIGTQEIYALDVKWP